MPIDNTAVRRTATRITLALAAAGAGVIALPTAAQAHVSVEPGQVAGGGFAVVAFHVPNERDDAATTKVQVILPQDQPLGSVQTTATPGWKVQTASRKLDEPIELFGATVNSVVSQVTWTATQGGVKPGQFQDFELSLGQFPDSGRLNFTALQTYDDGQLVRWNEVSADGQTEPEHPAPSLQITPAADEGAGDDDQAGDDEQAGQEATGGTQTQTDDAAASDSGNDAAPVVPIVLSGLALLVALAAAGLALRRGRI